MASLTRSQLKTSSNNTYDTNGVGGITATEVRTFNDDLIDSLITNDLTGGMSVLSASFALSASSINGQTLTSLNQYTASNDTKWSTLGGITGSFVTETESGSFLVTASVNLNTITFTKGNNSTFAITVNTGSAATTDITSLNQFTSSQLTINTAIGASTSSLNTFSASAQTSINALNTFTASQSTASLVTSITNLNTFSESTLTRLTNIESTTASLLIETSNLETFSASALVSINALNSATSSYVTETESGSFLITASVSLNTITFTKGNNTTFAVTVNTGSGTVTDLTSLNSFTASQDTKNSTLATYTASVDTKFTTVGASTSSLNNFTSSQLTINTGYNTYTSSTNSRLTNIEATTASLLVETQNLELFSSSALISLSNLNIATASFSSSINQLNVSSASQQISINAINAVSNSWVTESETGSFARTNAANLFTADQTIASANNLIISGSLVSLSGMFIPAGILNSDIQFSSPNSTLRIENASLNVDNTLTASLQEGYVWVGNSAGRTTTIPTSSFGGGSVPAGTISSSAQITSLGFVSSSVTASSLVTASFSGNTLTFTKGDASTFGVVIPDVSGSAGNFVTTSSFNAYTASVTQSIVTATVTNNGSNYYLIDGIQAPKLSFVPGPIYRFDLSGIAGNHPFKFSTTANGPTQYTTGVTSGSNFIQIEVGYDTTTPLYYYCTNHSGMGNEINVLAIEKLLTTASFNSYTSSTNTRLTNIESTTASLLIETQNLELFSASALISLSNLNTATASLFTSTSLSLTTASFSGNTLTFTKGNGTTFGVVIPDISGSTINTGSFATTGSNTFTGDQNLISSSIYLNGNGRIQMPNGAYFLGNPGDAFQLNSDSATFTVGSGNFNIHNDGSGALNIKHRNNNEINISGSATYIQNVNFIPFSASLNTRILAVTGSSINTGSFATTGSNTFIGNQLVTNGALQVANYNETSPQFYGPVVFQGVATASVAYDQFINAGNFDALHIETNLNAGTIFQDYGGGLNTWLSIPTNTGNNPAPIMGRGLVITGSTQVQNFTASLQQGYVYVGNASGITTTVATSSFIGNQLTSASFNAYTQSNDAKVNSLIARTGSYATTGSNTFIGDNQLVGIFQAADANIGLQGFAPTVFQGVGTSAVAYDQFVNAGNYDALHIETNLNAGTKFQDYGNSGLETWLQIPTNTGANNPKPIFKRGLEVTGSTNIQQLTASLQNGYAWVGNSDNQNTQVATSSFVINTGSFATTGSNTFVGNEIISGSLSVKGNVTFTSVNGITNNIILGNNAAANSIGVAQSVIIGQEAMQFASGSSGNIAIGIGALKLTSGSSNFGIGTYALTNNTSGDTNLAIGTGAGYYNTTGNRNIFIGFDAGTNTITGSSNTFIGAEAGADVTGSSNTIIGRVRGDSSLESTIIIAAGTSQKLRHENNVFQVTGSIEVSDGLSALGEFKLNVGGNNDSKPAGIGSVNTDGGGNGTFYNSLIIPTSVVLLTSQGSYRISVGTCSTGSVAINSSLGSSGVGFTYLIINPAV